jgi:hypothetical protein
MLFHDVRGYPSATRLMVLSCALLARLVLFGCRLWNIGFHECWRRRFLLFQCFDPSQRHTQAFLRVPQRFTQFLIFFPQLQRFFFFCYVLSASERSSLNSFPAKRAAWDALIRHAICTGARLAAGKP